MLVYHDMQSLRKGKWTIEEEKYANKIIEAFNEGSLCLPERSTCTTLRAYLAEKLSCDPMRITKKYAGESSLGKRVFHASTCSQSAQQVEQTQKEIDILEAKFLEKVETIRMESRKMEMMLRRQCVSTPAMDAMMQMQSSGWKMPSGQLAYPLQYPSMHMNMHSQYPRTVASTSDQKAADGINIPNITSTGSSTGASSSSTGVSGLNAASLVTCHPMFQPTEADQAFMSANAAAVQQTFSAPEIITGPDGTQYAVISSVPSAMMQMPTGMIPNGMMPMQMQMGMSQMTQMPQMGMVQMPNGMMQMVQMPMQMGGGMMQMPSGVMVPGMIPSNTPLGAAAANMASSAVAVKTEPTSDIKSKTSEGVSGSSSASASSSSTTGASLSPATSSATATADPKPMSLLPAFADMSYPYQMQQPQQRFVYQIQRIPVPMNGFVPSASQFNTASAALANLTASVATASGKTARSDSSTFNDSSSTDGESAGESNRTGVSKKQRIMEKVKVEQSSQQTTATPSSPTTSGDFVSAAAASMDAVPMSDSDAASSLIKFFSHAQKSY